MLKHSSKLLDYKGQKLCEACWNNAHYRHAGGMEQKRGKFIPIGERVSNCQNATLEKELERLRRDADAEQISKRRWDELEAKIAEFETQLKTSPCQCECRRLLKERPKRIKKDMTLQVPMFDIVESHKDEG